MEDYDSKGNLSIEEEYLYNHRIKGKQYLDGKLEFEEDYLFDK